jgi:hypothetical protein
LIRRRASRKSNGPSSARMMARFRIAGLGRYSAARAAGRRSVE